MFAIERITLINFRSFYGTHTFDLSRPPGLYHLTGQNLVNPGLEGCACGKSSLLDAIFWCLYGKTTRGLKAGDVVSWGEKGCWVDVSLNVGGIKWKIQRAQNPNALYWMDETGIQRPADQDLINRYLRLPHEAFLYSVIMPQFGDAFFDLTPSVKLNVFSAIMDLEFWLDKSYRAGLQAQELKNQKLNLESDAARFEGQYKTAETDLEALRQSELTFTQDQEKVIKEYELALTSILREARHTNDEISIHKKLLLKAEEKLAQAARKDVCPTCKQTVPNPDTKSLKQNKSDFEGKITRLEMNRHALKSREQSTKDAIARETAKVSPYAKLICDKKRALKEYDRQLDELAAHMAELDEKHYAVDFWVGGFKRIRLFIIEEALQQLELEVNNNLASLGLPDWHIGLDVERENKSGGITKGFTVMITPPGAKEPIRYESYSGSETQRLRLAGNLGLANLIMERAGLSNTIEFYDEPSAHMNPNGLVDLAEALAQRAKDGNKIIFMVDHHVPDFAGFTGTLTVTMDSRGSRL